MKNTALIKLAVLFYYFHCSSGTIAQSVSGVINSYYRITAVNTTANRVSVLNAGGLVPGIKVLIIQMKGAAINSDNLPSFGDISNIGEAGNYEYNTICAVAGNDILLKYSLTHSYSSMGSVQLIPVPQYNIITVSDTIKAGAWNMASGTGGVVVLEADTIYLNSAISVSGQGFVGEAFVNFSTPTYNCSWAVDVTNFFLPLAPSPNQYYSGGPKGEGIAAFIANAEYGRGKQANGGGGGNNHNTGGGGGANYGAGGNGGQRSNESFFLCHGTNPGIGGLAISSYGYSTADNRIFMGGGGGSGHQNNGKGTPGGNGGGIVLLTANVIIGAGTGIFADGLSPVNLTNVDPFVAEGDGGGGGGAGGSIILNVNQVIGTINATVRGGRGSDAARGVNDCLGPGGGGGAGVVWMKGPSVPSNLGVTVNGGSNGVISVLSGGGCVGQANGATSGGGGSALTGYLAPAMGNFLCAPLPVAELRSFKATIEQKNIILRWTMINTDHITTYEVERSIDQVGYSVVTKVVNDGDYSYTINDHSNFTGTIYYRLKLTRQNGTVGYSQIVHVTKNDQEFNQLNIFPNPAMHQLKISTLVKKDLDTWFSIFNVAGQRVYHHQFKISAGYTTLSIPVTKLSPGIYWLMVEAPGWIERKKFIKSN